MTVSFNGFNEKAVTFLCGDGVEAGGTVVVSDNGTVSAAEEGDILCGVVSAVDGDCASVQLTGYVRLPYSSTAPEAGYNTLSCDGNGGVCVDEDGKSYLVIDVDTTDTTVGFIL